MIDSQQRAGYNHLVSNKHEGINCVIKNKQEILLDLADFALQEQPDNLMVAIFHVPWLLSQLNPWNCIIQRSSF